MHDPIAEVAAGFAIAGSYLESRPYVAGHINDTYVAAYSQGGTRVRYIIQRINEQIFRDPPAMMDNILRVTGECHRRLREAGVPDSSRRALTVIPSVDGGAFRRDGAGNYWRAYMFIEGTRTFDVAQSEKQACEAAKGFGEFQRLVSQLTGEPLHETIPRFHHTRSRFDRLREAAETDSVGRLAEAREEWEFFQRREKCADVLLGLEARGEIPSRVTHNDTKLNNVLIDDATGEAICVVDLDTVMPGLALYDFGDMVRTATSPAEEDERDLSLVGMRMPMFEALVAGYLASAGAFLNEAELDHLAFSGKLITLETGMRFLTDFLEGDTYFKTHRAGQNLDRCRTQIALVRSIENQQDAMEKVVRRMSRRKLKSDGKG